MPRPRSERRSTWPAVVLAVAFALPVVYVLSVGPAWAMMNNSQISGETYNTLYRPVTWPYKHNETYARWLTAYVKWWDAIWPTLPNP